MTPQPKFTELGTGTTKPHGKEGLEIFPDPSHGALIEFRIPEFTCLCPVTGQPDFATIYIRYIPWEKCVESKSLKLYMWHFRDRGAFHEAVTSEICETLNELLLPTWIQVVGVFGVRGGIYEKVAAEAINDDLGTLSEADIAYYRFKLSECHG